MVKYKNHTNTSKHKSKYVDTFYVHSGNSFQWHSKPTQLQLMNVWDGERKSVQVLPAMAVGELVIL